MIRIVFVSVFLLLGTAINIVTSSSYDTTFSTSSLQKALETRLEKASKLAALEQKVEDYNACHVATTSSSSSQQQLQQQHKRRLLCLPLDDRFNPPMGVFSHDHVQTGDKISVPRIFWTAIEDTKAQVPWLMEISRVDDFDTESVASSTMSTSDELHHQEEHDNDDEEEEGEDTPQQQEQQQVRLLHRVVGGPLDFRAPMNYCFLPWWMMRAMGLGPMSIVDVRLIPNVPPGSAAQLRPHSMEFARDITNPQAVLETELKHYSSLTKGSVIAFDYNGKRYWFDVVDLRSAPRGEKCDWIKVQDCDIATDFLPAVDKDKNKKKPHHDNSDEQNTKHHGKGGNASSKSKHKSKKS